MLLFNQIFVLLMAFGSPYVSLSYTTGFCFCSYFGLRLHDFRLCPVFCSCLMYVSYDVVLSMQGHVLWLFILHCLSLSFHSEYCSNSVVIDILPVI